MPIPSYSQSSQCYRVVYDIGFTTKKTMLRAQTPSREKAEASERQERLVATGPGRIPQSLHVLWETRGSTQGGESRKRVTKYKRLGRYSNKVFLFLGIYPVSTLILNLVATKSGYHAEAVMKVMFLSLCRGSQSSSSHFGTPKPTRSYACWRWILANGLFWMSRE